MRIGDKVKIKRNLKFQNTGISKIEDYIGKETKVIGYWDIGVLMLEIDDGIYEWYEDWLEPDDGIYGWDEDWLEPVDIEALDIKFYDFSGGVPIDNSTKNQFIQEVYKQLKTGRKCYSCQSGNFMVVGIRYETEIKIFVSENYKCYTECIFKIRR